MIFVVVPNTLCSCARSYAYLPFPCASTVVNLCGVDKETNCSNFTELLGVNSTREENYIHFTSTVTVNDVVGSSRMPAWHVTTNIPLSTWVFLSKESKLSYFKELQLQAESAVNYVDVGPQTSEKRERERERERERVSFFAEQQGCGNGIPVGCNTCGKAK